METKSTPDTAHIKPPSSRKVTLLLGGILLVLVVLFIIGLLPHLRQQERLAVEAAQSRTETEEVTVVTPHFAPSDSLVLPGSVQAIEEANLNARTTGFVRRRYVDIGSRVKAGQLLAEIESPEVDQQLLAAHADEAKAVAGTGQARADVANKQATVAQSQAAVAQTQATVAQTQAVVSQMQANLGQARAAQKRAEAKLLQAQAATGTARAKLAQTRQALAGRQADLVQQQSQATLAERTWQRWQGLAKSGAVSRQEADEKEFAYLTRKAAVNSADAAVHSAEADVDAAKATVSSSEADEQAAEEDISAAKESVNAATSMVASSKSNVEAARSSVDASRASVTATKAGVDASRANVQAAQAVSGSSRATAQRYAVLQGFQRITAPFSGVITSRSIDAGSLVKADDSTTAKNGLFGLARTDVLRIMVSVPQTYAANMQPGQTVKVTIREFPGKFFTGIIARNAGALDPATRTLLTEIHVNNADGKLLPGMYSQVEFGSLKSKPHLRIPANALVIGAEGIRVAIVNKANKIHFQPVVLGADNGQETEVVSGLTGDETLVTNASDDLKEGVTVKPIAAPPAELPGGPPPAHPTSGATPPPAVH